MSKSGGNHYIFRSCIFIGLLYSSILSGAQQKTLGFTVLKASGIDTYDAKVFSQILHTAINQVGVYSTLNFSDITLRLAEQGIVDACYDAQCAIVAGQILGVEYFGFGSIGKIGRAFTISMQVLEVRTGRIVSDISEFYKGNASSFKVKCIPVFASKISGIKIDEGRKRKR